MLSGRSRKCHKDAGNTAQLQGHGGAGSGEGPGDGGPLTARYEVHPGQILTWKKALVEGASGVFGSGKDQKSKSDAAMIARLYQEIGQLKVERDFLAERSGP